MRVILDLPEDAVAAIAASVARIVGEQHRDPNPWIGVDDAAAHLACPRSRIYRLVSQDRIPFEKDGARLLFRRSDLDAWVARGGAGRC
jgi:excisionase family DNA binding protein